MERRRSDSNRCIKVLQTRLKPPTGLRSRLNGFKSLSVTRACRFNVNFTHSSRFKRVAAGFSEHFPLQCGAWHLASGQMSRAFFNSNDPCTDKLDDGRATLLLDRGPGMIRMFGGTRSFHREASFSFHGPAERLERRDWEKGNHHESIIKGREIQDQRKRPGFGSRNVLAAMDDG